MRKDQRKERNHKEVVVNEVLSDIRELYSNSDVVKSHNVASLPQVARSELRLGKLLGEGSFSRAFELESVVPPPAKRVTKRGEMSRALLVSNLRRRPLVVKFLRPNFSKNPEKFRAAATDLVKEAAFLASLQHPHIISIRGVAAEGARAYADGSTDGFFIVMDRIECTLLQRMQLWRKQMGKCTTPMLAKIGPNLNNVLFAGRLEVIGDISSALVFLHERRIVFRDLKPDNIGFDANGKVKLIDFGLVIEIPKHGIIPTTIGVGGTLRYLAPECYLGKRYNANVDVYSLAIVLWEVLSLSTFFPVRDRAVFVRHIIHRNERPSIPQEWPYGVRALVRRGWSQWRQHRPSMQEFHDGIEHEINKLKRLPEEEEDYFVAPRKDDSSLATTESTESSWSWMGDIFFMMHPY